MPEIDPSATRAAAILKALNLMGITAAPLVEQVKPYSRPLPRADVRDAKARADAIRSGVCSAATTAATAKVADLEETLRAARAKPHSSQDLLKVLAKDASEAKAEQAKLLKGANTAQAKNAVYTQLTNRVAGAAASAEAAEGRHRVNLDALDEQIALLQSIRAHKENDYEQAQLATRNKKDRETVAEVGTYFTLLGSEAPAAPAADGAAPMDTTVEAADKILAELLRESPGAVAEDFPPCPNTTEPAVVSGLAAL
jgi:hypothetical protein